MNMEKYAERVRGFIQSAQTLVVRAGHRQSTPLHASKVRACRRYHDGIAITQMLDNS
jgi:hypothetical protein